MQDFVQKIALPENKFKKIHGHTKIELRKADTGEVVQTVEHDNTFQAEALRSYFDSLGWGRNIPLYSGNSNWVNRKMALNIMGGILLFRDTIPLGSMFMPAGNQMTGNGAALHSNNGLPQELGSYNDVESVITPTSATLVFDWGTAQANGQISCVCLTSRQGGFIGYGNPSKRSQRTYANYLQPNSDTVNFNMYQSYGDITQNKENIGSRYLVAGDYIYNITFNFTGTNRKIFMEKRRFSVKELTLFDNEIVKTTTIDLEGTDWDHNSSGYYNGNYHAIQITETKIIFLVYVSTRRTLNGYWGKYKDAFRYILYDTVTDTYQLLTLNWGAVADITQLTSPYIIEEESGLGWCFTDRYLYMVTYHGDKVSPSDYNYNVLLKFDITNGAFISATDLEYPFNGKYKESESGNERYIKCDLSEIFPNILMYPISLDTYTAKVAFYDVTTGSILPTNLGYETRYKRSDYYKALIMLGEGTVTRYLIHNPLYLATINNLETPVVKDSTMVMKVTYTLTEAQEQEENE